jgi:hypothetical protein
MHRITSTSRGRRVCLGLAACALFAGTASGATIDFSNATVPGGYGNTIQVTSEGITVNAYAWGETGSLQTTVPSSFWFFQTAEINSFSTGLGICNRMEGDLATGCDTNEREIDTVGRDDLLVLFFNQAVSFDNLEITVDPWDGIGDDPNDRDLRYWIATVATAPNLSTFTFNTLTPTFGNSALSNASSSFNEFTHLLHSPTGIERSGNVLLISGDYMNRNCVDSDITSDSECEAWKLKSIVVTSAVPVPAAVWMLGSALGLLSLVRRKTA